MPTNNMNNMGTSGMPEMQMPYGAYGAMPQAGNPMLSASPGQPLPTGVPSGPPYGNSLMGAMTPAANGAMQVPQTVQNPLYLAGFLRTQIGKRMRVEFLIGTNGPMVDRTGTLLGVGTSYILLQPTDSDDVMVCDLYSIKFVTILL